VRSSIRKYSSVLLIWLVPCSIGAPPVTGAGFDSVLQVSTDQQRAPVKRALLVGIGLYQPTVAEEKPADQGVVESQAAKPQQPPGARGGRLRFSNLDGPKTDLAAMRAVLKDRFGFTVINELIDQQATRQAILQAIQKYLIDEASEGDICVFYYSGHGSQVRNSKGGEPDGMDESIVPADTNRGAKDIRDKELARIFLKAINEKKVKLTVILDSCHSGSAARGYPREEKSRALDPILEDANDPPGFDKSPEELGALVLSAAQDKEEAKERRYDGQWRGNFSYALTEALGQPFAPYQSAEKIFQVVTSIMRSEGASHQPVMAGDAERRKSELFGEAFGASGGPAASILKVLDRTNVELHGGRAIGLRKGTELKKIGGLQGAKPVRLRVTEVKNLNSAEAMAIEGSVSSLKAGDLFTIDNWVSPDSPDLRVWMPASLNVNELASTVREASALQKSGRIEWIDDPTKTVPSRVVEFDRSGWRLLAPGGATQTIGRTLSVSNIASPTGGPETLFFNLPPSLELRESVKLGPGTERQAIEITRSPDAADYVLAGRLEGGKPQYAWVRPGVSTEDAKDGTNPLPVRTNWVDGSDPAEAGKKLEEYAVTLSRIRAWNQVQGGPSDEFPYTLALRDTNTRELIRQISVRDGKGRVAEVREGHNYDLVLIADENGLKRLQDAGRRVSQRWIYVFAIDSSGNSSLLFNQLGNIDNQYPVAPNLAPLEQPKLMVLGKQGMVTIGPPFGLDTYIMLTSEEPIPDPFVLEFTGVVSRGRASGDSQTARLFSALGSGSRGPDVSAPLNWSIDRFVLRSVAKSQ
jgi:hypothetical protein